MKQRAFIGAAFALIGLAWLLLFSVMIEPAHANCTAPCTKAQVTTDINTNWPDNTTGAITPAILRSTVLDLVNSYLDVNGSSTFTCPTHQFLVSIATLSSYTCGQPAVADLSGFGTGVATALGVNVGTAGAFVVQGGALGTPSSGDGSNLTNLNGTNIASGTVANARLVGSGATTVAGSTCTLGSTCGLSALANSIPADVNLSNTTLYFDGPSVAQGSTGVWLAMGSVIVSSTTADGMICKIWDGTTVADIGVQNISAGTNNTIALSGIFSSPAGNIKISCKDASSTNGKIVATADGVTKASTLNVIRIQ